jgi:hypothetical protein
MKTFVKSLPRSGGILGRCVHTEGMSRALTRALGSEKGLFPRPCGKSPWGGQRGSALVGQARSLVATGTHLLPLLGSLREWEGENRVLGPLASQVARLEKSVIKQEFPRALEILMGILEGPEQAKVLSLLAYQQDGRLFHEGALCEGLSQEAVAFLVLGSLFLTPCEQHPKVWRESCVRKEEKAYLAWEHFLIKQDLQRMGVENQALFTQLKRVVALCEQGEGALFPQAFRELCEQALALGFGDVVCRVLHRSLVCHLMLSHAQAQGVKHAVPGAEHLVFLSTSGMSYVVSSQKGSLFSYSRVKKMEDFLHA